MGENRLMLDDGSLVDLLDRLLDTGVALDGNVLITLAGVDLIRLDLRLLLSSVESLRDPRERRAGPHHRQHGLRDRAGRPFQVDNPHGWYQPGAREPGPPPDHYTRLQPQRPGGVATAAEPFTAEAPAASAPGMVGTAAEPTGGPAGGTAGGPAPAPGVAGLVVAVVDLVRQLLERQALRRMEAGALTDAEVERLGSTLRALERQVHELTEALGLRSPPT